MSTEHANHTCGLCGSHRALLMHTYAQRPLAGRRFLRCLDCGLIQVATADRLSPAAEKAEYDLHQNSPDDPAYRAFLHRLTEPLRPVLSGLETAPNQPSLQGLDFGSGPGPLLSSMLQQLGYPCVDYDLFYAHDPHKLEQVYDFITATEVFEHLATPADVLTTLTQCLRPHGVLAVMMQRPDEQPEFARWGYIKDPTHISFYTNQALSYINKRWSLIQRYRDRDVIIWQRGGA